MEILEKLRKRVSEGWKSVVSFWADEDEDISLAPDSPKKTTAVRDASFEEEEIIEEGPTLKERARTIAQEMRSKTVACWGRRTGTEKMAILFVCGLVLGAGVKVIANDRITIGYRDYTAKSGTYDFIALQKKVATEGGSAAVTGGNLPGDGGSCAQ